MPTTSQPQYSRALPPQSSRFDQNDPIEAEEARLRAKIAVLKAKQRRQTLIESLEVPKRKSGGMRFVHAFLIVLGLHIAAIGGFYGFSAVKKMHASDKLALKEKAPAYAGVPDTEAKPANGETIAPSSHPATNIATAEIPAKGKSNVVLSSLPAQKKTLPPDLESRAKHAVTSLKPSPALRAIFSHGHSPASQNDTAAEADADPISQAPVATPHPKPAPPSHYTVGPGDTLSKVAAMMGIPPSRIREANGLNSGNSLRVGQNLSIPSPVMNPPLQLIASEPAPQNTRHSLKKLIAPQIDHKKPEHLSTAETYTVLRGDNPYSIAHRMGVSFYDLMVANNITNPADITIGMKLKVPVKLASN